MPGGSDEEREAAAAAEIPLGRMGRKWDIAMGVLYLASPAAGGSVTEGICSTQIEIKETVPLGRMGAKWDIAMGCLYLVSPAAGEPVHGDIYYILDARSDSLC